jgi:hypothetical protein
MMVPTRPVLHVAASSDHAEVAGLRFDVVHDLAGVDVKADRIVDLNDGVRVADGPAVGRVQVGHVLGSDRDGLDAAAASPGIKKAYAVAVVKPIILVSHLLADTAKKIRVVDPHFAHYTSTLQQLLCEEKGAMKKEGLPAGLPN